MTRTVLITGITGQDGGYLAQKLLTEGWNVLGVVRNPVGAQLATEIANSVRLLEWDMHDTRSIADVLSRYKPGAIYNLAARSSGAGMFNEPVAITEDNGVAVTHLLEAIRMTDPTIRFCQASSSEMFGHVTEGMQTECTPFRPRSPYGAAKLYAHTMVDIYRRHHGLFACSAILYNHESPRRNDTFVTGKIARGAARIRRGLADRLSLGNLDARRDWGYAPDYMEAMYLMLQQPAPDDYVIATGETHSVSDFCNIAFRHVGLDYRDYVRDDSTAVRRAAEVPLCGDSGKARKVLGWQPRTRFLELVRLMVDDALRIYATTDEAYAGHEGDDR